MLSPSKPCCSIFTRGQTFRAVDDKKVLPSSKFVISFSHLYIKLWHKSLMIESFCKVSLVSVELVEAHKFASTDAQGCQNYYYYSFMKLK